MPCLCCVREVSVSLDVAMLRTVQEAIESLFIVQDFANGPFIMVGFARYTNNGLLRDHRS